MKRVLPSVLVLLIAVNTALAHVGSHPSVHDTVAGVIQRLKKEVPREELQRLTVKKVGALLKPEERHVLATEHLSFGVDVPVTVFVASDARLGDEPFWLAEEGFAATEYRLLLDGEDSFKVWKKDFGPGQVGLGVNSLSGNGDHYFVVVKPKQPGATVKLVNIYPGRHRVGVLRNGEPAYGERADRRISGVPAELDGQLLLRGDNSRRKDAQLVNIFQFTPYPATAQPDHVVLTWSGDPRTTQAIQWRTSTEVKLGWVQYQRKADYHRFQPARPLRVKAETRPLVDTKLVNDATVHRHTAELSGLQPGTSYVYCVGDGSESGWTELAEFTTAPDREVPFSFVYMGDAQNGLDRWGSLLRQAYRTRPDAAFYIMAGDLVNRGAERSDWDSFFQNAQGIFDRRQLVPCLGNHEYQGDEPRLYLEQFALPENGPDTIGPERAYAFKYSNALFVVLDSNQPPSTQTAWLEKQLASDAVWKFVVYHHPAYSSTPKRDNREVRELWGALFDKYHVDMALQGHDHAYLRTYPMHQEKRVDSPAKGTVYVIAVSGTKFYKQDDLDYIEVGMTNVATYQVLDIQISGNRLVYRAYDLDGNKRDELIIEK